MPKQKQRKETTYNKILKEFTKINNKLPEERKLSISDRRKIIKEQIYPQYRGVPKYKIRIKELRSVIYREYEKVPPKEICDLNYIDISEYAYVEWFALDETISELVPNCVYVKVTAGEYGETRIFNTLNYSYGRAGVRSIVEAIRPDAENSSGKYIFGGYKKLRPRKRNDGTPENYYLDFVLFIIDRGGLQDPQGDTESVQFNLPRTRDVRKKRTKIRNVIEQKIKSLKSKKDSRRRAKKTLERNITKFTKTVRSVNKAKKPTADRRASARKQFNQTVKLLERYFAQGKLTQNQYDKAIEKIFREFNDGE